MTEAFLRKLDGDRFRIFSAGLVASEIHPLTHRVMEEVGIPLTGQHSKSTREFLGKLAVHHLIIVCERTERECPKLFLGAARRHSWPFPDPVVVEGSTNVKLVAFREVRDAIRRRAVDWLSDMEPGSVGNRR